MNALQARGYVQPDYRYQCPPEFPALKLCWPAGDIQRKNPIVTKAELKQLFPTIAGSAIRPVHDAFCIIGRYVIIEPLDGGLWDCWICNARDIPKGLGTGKRNNIAETAPKPCTLNDGEAWWQGSLPEVRAWVEENQSYLGIRLRRVMTDEQRLASAERFSAIRKKGVIHDQL